MLVSVDELRAYMNYTPEHPGQLVTMGDLLKRVQKSVETAINRPVEHVQIRETRLSDSKGFLYLRVTPVWKLISCGGASAQDILERTPTYTIIADPDFPDARMWDFSPRSTVGGFPIVPGGLRVGTPCAWYTVEYVGGLDPAYVDDIKQIIISVAARIYGTNNVGAVGLQSGSPDQIDLGDNRVPWLSDDEKRSLQRYKRRVFR